MSLSPRTSPGQTHPGVGVPPELREERGAKQGASGLLTEHQYIIPKLASFPGPREPQTFPFLTPSVALLFGLQPGTEGTSAAHPPHTCTGIPHDAPPQDHHKSQRKNLRAWKHQPKMPRTPRGSSSWGSGMGKLFPVTLPHNGNLYNPTQRVCSCLHFGIVELEGDASAQQMMAGVLTRQLCPLGRAQSDRRCSGHTGMSQQTDLYWTAAAEQPVRGGEGGNAPSPQKCTQLGRRDAFTARGQQSRADPIALTQVGLP